MQNPQATGELQDALRRYRGILLQVLLASFAVIVLTALRRLPKALKRLFTSRYIQRTISTS